MKTYKILKGYYDGLCEEDLVLPKDLKLLYLDGDVGSCLTYGCNHYLGCIRKPEDGFDIELEIENQNNFGLEFYNLGELLLIVIDNIKFVSESPKFYTPEEFNIEFEIDKYFIETREFDYFRADESGNTLFSEEEDWVEGKTCNISKIVKILGPYNIEVSTVVNYSDLYKTNLYSMSVRTVSLNDLLFEFRENTKLIVYKGDDSKYKEMIKRVLDKF